MWIVLAAAVAHAAPAATAAPAAPACDVKGLQKALVEATPNAAGKAYADLAACDAAAAKAAAPEAFKRIVAGPNADVALVAAVKVGAWEPVRDWIPAQQPDDRSSAINELGQACDVKEVPAFFIDAAKQLGEKFWSERWYAGLDECRDAGVRELLRAEVAKPTRDSIRFKNILETFSRNLGADAIPVLKTLASEQKDAEVSTYIVEAFGDAAGLGSASGPNPDAQQAAAAAIVEVAPALPDKALEKARQMLLALGSELESDKLVAVRYKDRKAPDGTLTYGVVSAEVATCKKGDTRIAYHHAQVVDTGHTWPDQVLERIEPGLAGAFELDLAESCKGTGTVKHVVPEAPFKGQAAYEAWVDETLKQLQKENPPVKSAKVEPHDPLKI